MAINKPNNYEEVQAQGEFTPVDLGGHHLVIKQISEKKSSTGKDMLVILFDFDTKDKQSGYFMEQFKNDVRPDKKYPNQATHYMVIGEEDWQVRNLKTFTTCAEHSNPGFKVSWGDKFCECFKGKKIGGVFGIVEELYNGEVKRKRVLRWFCSSDKVDDAPIPEDKLLPDDKKPNAAYNGGDGFMQIPDGIDSEELPFN